MDRPLFLAKDPPAEHLEASTLRAELEHVRQLLARRDIQIRELGDLLQAERIAKAQALQERDEARESAALLQTAFDEIGAALKRQQTDMAAAGHLARFVGEALTSVFSHYLPDAERKLLTVKQGRVPGMLLEISPILSSLKDLPDDPRDGLLRKDLIAKVELIWKQGYTPFMLHIREAGRKHRGEAQSVLFTGVKGDGTLHEDVETEAVEIRDRLLQLSSCLQEVISKLPTAGEGST